jgi:elongation factor P
MVNVNDLKVGALFVYNEDPCIVLWSNHLKMQQRRPVMQTKFRNLRTGKVFEQNFQQGEVFEEADINRLKVVFLFEHRGQYTFQEKGNPKNRINFTAEQLGGTTQYLRPNMDVDAIRFGEEILNIELPPKMDLKVTEAPPTIRGNTATGGTKAVTLETGLVVQVPLFIEEGDTVRVNTQLNEYVERVEKGK